MANPDERPVLTFETQAEWREWLDANHHESDGVWVVFAKKGSGASTASYVEVVEVALCYGWIDSQTKRIDDHFYKQAYTPRRARSPWSLINVERADALVEAGLMRPAGQAEIERAKADGRWDAAYAGPATAQMPPDFLDALAQNPAAQTFYETLTSQNRYAIYFRIHHAKRPETRARRIETFVAMLSRGETLY